MYVLLLDNAFILEGKCKIKYKIKIYKTDKRKIIKSTNVKVQLDKRRCIFKYFKFSYLLRQARKAFGSDLKFLPNHN